MERTSVSLSISTRASVRSRNSSAESGATRKPFCDFRDHQPLCAQPRKRLAHRAKAHLVCLGDVVDAEFAPRHQAAPENVRPHRAEDAIGLGLAAHGFTNFLGETRRLVNMAHLPLACQFSGQKSDCTKKIYLQTQNRSLSSRATGKIPEGGNGLKLFRHGPLGAEAAGALDSRGAKRDLSLLIPDITPDWLSPEKLKAIAAIDLEKMPLVADGARIGAPVGGVRQFIAIGLNYRKHAAESGMALPKDPLVFNKALDLHPGAERRHPTAGGFREDGLGGRTRASSSGPRLRTSRRTPRFLTSPAIASPTTFRSATGRPIEAASGSRARASTPSARSDLGS